MSRIRISRINRRQKKEIARQMKSVIEGICIASAIFPPMATINGVCRSVVDLTLALNEPGKLKQD